GLPFEADKLDEDLMDQFAVLREVRQAVNAELEKQRAAKLFGKSTEAEVTVRVHGPEGADDSEQLLILRSFGETRLADLFIVSGVTLDYAPAEEPRLEVMARKSPHASCARCWRALAEGGKDAAH